LRYPCSMIHIACAGFTAKTNESVLDSWRGRRRCKNTGARLSFKTKLKNGPLLQIKHGRSLPRIAFHPVGVLMFSLKRKFLAPILHSSRNFWRKTRLASLTEPRFFQPRCTTNRFLSVSALPTLGKSFRNPLAAVVQWIDSDYTVACRRRPATLPDRG